MRIRDRLIDPCAVNEPRAPSGSPDLARKMLAARFLRCASLNKLCLVALAGLAGIVIAAAWLRFDRNPPIENRRGISPAESQPPIVIDNVLLISIDTCRADHLSCYGFDQPTTPHIDAIAGEGAVFENVVAPVPLTLPAHSSMLTGLTPLRHGVHDNFEYRLGQSQVTLAEILKDHGFSTGAFVSAFVLDSQFGLDQGFDTYHDQFEKHHGPIHHSERSAGATSRLAIQWLEQHQHDRFFCFLHFFDPHAEYEPPEPFASRFADSAYAGEIAYADHCIGQVIARLKELGLYEKTLLVIVGDHGEMLGEHGEAGHGFFVYHGAIRVPMIFKLPGQHESQRIKELTGLIDIVPTVCRLLGVDAPPSVQGADLSGAVVKQDRPLEERAYYCESLTPTKYNASPLLAVVTRRWKYIQTTRPELFDLVEDPQEIDNLAESQLHQARLLQDRLLSMLEEQAAATDSDAKGQLDAESVARLEALGYVSGRVAEGFAFDDSKDDPKDLIEFHLNRQQALTLISRQQYSEATRLMNALLAQRPDYLDAHRELANIATLQNDLPKAVLHLTAALKLEPDHPQLHNDLGVAVASQGTLDAAIPRFRHAIQLKTDYADAQRNLATALAALGKHEEAANHYRQALEINPDDLKSLTNLGAILYSQDKMDDAVEHFRRATAIRPDSARYHSKLAEALAKTNRFDEAIVHFREAVRLQPSHPVFLNHLASILAMRPNRTPQDADEAVEVARRAAELTKQENPVILATLASAYASRGQFDQAAATAQAALRLPSAQESAALTKHLQSLVDHYQQGKR